MHTQNETAVSMCVFDSDIKNTCHPVKEVEVKVRVNKLKNGKAAVEE